MSIRHASMMLDFFQNPAVRLFYVYGPAEATVITIYHCLTQNDKNVSQISCGTRLKNHKIQLRDRYLQQVAIGQVGELFIGGDAVFCGYLMKPEITKQVLVPFDNDNGECYYQTGDLFRLDQNGQLYFIGRKDNQVKLRGQRIELGEIEQILLSSSFNVSACAVIKTVYGNQDHLIAYVQTSDGNITEQRLVEECNRLLPRFMIPTRIVILAELPYNRNGKIDRKRLPSIQTYSYDDPNKTTSRNNFEEQIHHIWCDILGIVQRKIPLDANFFSLGGTSLTLMQVLYRYHLEFHVQCDISLFFEHATIHDHANFLLKINATSILWQHMSMIEGPVSYAQERIFLDESLRFNTDAKNMAIYQEISVYRVAAGCIKNEKLRQAIALILETHTALRTSFQMTADGLRKKIESGIECNYSTTIFSDTQQLQAIEREEITNRSLFDLKTGHLIRCYICLWHENHENTDFDILLPFDVIILSFHHIAADGEAFRILNEDLCTALNDGTLSVSGNSISYTDCEYA